MLTFQKLKFFLLLAYANPEPIPAPNWLITFTFLKRSDPINRVVIYPNPENKKKSIAVLLSLQSNCSAWDNYDIVLKN